MNSPPFFKIKSGCPWPLGAQLTTAQNGAEQGVNFAVFSAHADHIELCLFDASAAHELQRLSLPGRTRDVFHGFVPGLQAGAVYGLRAHGPWQPERGHRFNPHKLLLDPYARETVGKFEWRAEHFGGDQQEADNAAWALKARVPAPFETPVDTHLYTPLARSVIYEMHVKGFTAQHPGVPAALRGTYAGLAHEAALDHLCHLGVTAVCLLPVHQHLDEERLVQMGLRNYWGYNTLAFFCPEPSLAASATHARAEFRHMVDSLHARGIEVLLDVVYNHTAEGNELGPTLSLRGLDNAAYYRLPALERDTYENHSGCGNTLNIRHVRVLQLVLDSLRYWAHEMQVDGFRFDLAPVLGRGNAGFDRHAAFFAAVAQDPLLSRLKMIAEPWDVGPGGYQLGEFPSGWLEWNDHFRDMQRRFWNHGHGSRGEFALRLCGSSDLFQGRGRQPLESVNYVVSHDGFTLHDLVSYQNRHNQANGEDNHDGHSNNHSANWGFEGESNDVQITAQREHIKRALLACTLLSQGTPMMAAGDEMGHTQGGNNNPYCQDNALTWLKWNVLDVCEAEASCRQATAADLLAYTQHLIQLRHRFQPWSTQWYAPAQMPTNDIHALHWLQADGRALSAEDWQRSDVRTLACWVVRPLASSFSTAAVEVPDTQKPLLWLFNGGHEEQVFQLSAAVEGAAWSVLLDTAQARGIRPGADVNWTEGVRVAGRSVVLLVS